MKINYEQSPKLKRKHLAYAVGGVLWLDWASVHLSYALLHTYPISLQVLPANR